MAVRTVARSFATASSKFSSVIVIDAVTQPWASEEVRSTSSIPGSASSIPASA